MSLSNMFSNKFDNLVNSSNKEDVISNCQIKNTMSYQIFATERNKVTNHYQIDERAFGKNKVTGYSEIEKKALRKSRVSGYSK